MSRWTFGFGRKAGKRGTTVMFKLLDDCHGMTWWYCEACGRNVMSMSHMRTCPMCGREVIEEREA